MKTFRFFISLLKTSIKASITKRGAFLIESGLMIANNLIFFSIWWIFFNQFKNVGGWEVHDMAILLAIGTGSYGFMQVLFGGVRSLSRMIPNGELDPFMTQPKNLLLHIAGSRSLSKGWGHILSSITLVILAGIHSPATLLLILISILSGCLVFTSFNIVMHSLPFWMGSVETLSKMYCDALFLFALYPTNIYSGALQLVMFTLIPAGIIGYLPVELIRHFTWMRLFILLFSSATLFTLSFLFFYAGLKKYESGNKFGMRL